MHPLSLQYFLSFLPHCLRCVMSSFIKRICYVMLCKLVFEFVWWERVEVAWNNAFPKIFNAYWYESVKPLQHYCSCLPVSTCYPRRNCYFGRKCCVNWFCADWQSVMMPVSFLWQQNSILNLMTLFALVLRVSLLRTVFGFIFLNYHSHYYVFFCIMSCVLSGVFYFYCSCCIREY